MHLIWHSGRGRRRNYLLQMFWWSVEGCRFCGGRKLPLSIDKPVAVNTGLALPRSLWWFSWSLLYFTRIFKAEACVVKCLVIKTGFVVCRIWHISHCCGWNDELTETPRDLQVEENRDLLLCFITHHHRVHAQICDIQAFTKAFLCKTSDKTFCVWTIRTMPKVECHNSMH